jgi:hypothetical protein
MRMRQWQYLDDEMEDVSSDNPILLIEEIL